MQFPPLKNLGHMAIIWVVEQTGQSLIGRVYADDLHTIPVVKFKSQTACGSHKGWGMHIETVRIRIAFSNASLGISPPGAPAVVTFEPSREH